jgi:hypothetical protein
VELNGLIFPCLSAASVAAQPKAPPMSAREPSVEELREDSERTREALASTIEELREKVGDTAAELKTLVSPTHIKQELKDYVRDERDSLYKSVQRKAQENPLQLAAVGAAIAYPAWGLLRAIPTPLLLISAGLFLTSKKGQKSARDVTDPPPLKWSDLKYVFWHQGGPNAEEALISPHRVARVEC